MSLGLDVKYLRFNLNNIFYYSINVTKSAFFQKKKIDLEVSGYKFYGQPSQEFQWRFNLKILAEIVANSLKEVQKC